VTGEQRVTGGNEHPAAEFDDAVHHPNRLGILIVLHEAGRADFTYLKGALGLTDGNLGRHLTALESSGLVRIDKGFEGRRPRTWAQLTPTGRRALKAELDAMRRLLDRVDRPREP
jgi:DNA-binding MarR family transcriptional regulator